MDNRELFDASMGASMMDFHASVDFNASTLNFGSDSEEDNNSMYFDAPKPNEKPQRPGLGPKMDSAGALEALMSAKPVPKSPAGNGARKTLREDSTSWNKLKQRMKSPKRLGSPRRVSSPSRISTLEESQDNSLVASSDHALVARRRATVSVGMTGGTRTRPGLGARAMSSTSHGGRATSRFDTPPDPESPQKSPRQRLRLRKKKEAPPEEPSLEDDAASEAGSLTDSRRASKSPKSRRKVKDLAEETRKKILQIADDNASPISESRQRARRKGNKKADFTSLTPNPRSKPMVEVEDISRFTDVNGGGKKKTKQLGDDEIGKKYSSDDGTTGGNTSLDSLPMALPFGEEDDDGGTVTSAKTSGSGKKEGKKKKKRKDASISKSPGKLKQRKEKVDVAGFENDIHALQEEVLRLKQSKISGDSETSEHMKELRRKAFEARLELQKAELENRQVRSDLRDTTNALNEAELDIETLEKKLRDKDAEIIRLRQELKNAGTNGSTDVPPPPAAPVSTPKSNQTIIDRYETIINRKDTKLANLERELRRLRKSGGAAPQSELDDLNETIADLQKALKESQAKTIAISKKFNETRGEAEHIEQEIEHWKSQAIASQDEIAELRSQLKYWMAKYEDVVGASDAAKAQLAAPGAQPNSIRQLSKRNLNAGNSVSSDDIDDDKPEDTVGGLWSKLTSPGKNEQRKLNGSSLGMRASYR